MEPFSSDSVALEPPLEEVSGKYPHHRTRSFRAPAGGKDPVEPHFATWFPSFTYRRFRGCIEFDRSYPQATSSVARIDSNAAALGHHGGHNDDSSEH